MRSGSRGCWPRILSHMTRHTNSSSLWRQLRRASRTLPVTLLQRRLSTISLEAEGGALVGVRDTEHRTQHQCKHCGAPHDPSKCRFRKLECNYCHNVGHIAAVCRKRLAQRGEEAPQQGSDPHVGDPGG